MASASRTEIQYKFIIGKPLQVSSNTFDPDSNSTFEYSDHIDESDVNSFIFTEHDMTYSVTMTNQNSQTNKANITLYNAPDDAIKYLMANKDNHVICALYVGDNVTGLGLISSGEVVKLEDKWEAETRTTTFSVDDGSLFLKNAFTSRKFAAGTSKLSIVKGLCLDLKIPIGQLANFSGIINSPKTFFGSTNKILKSFIEPEGYRHNIYNGKSYVIPYKARVESVVSYISNDSGLIGRISQQYDNSANSTDNLDSNGGITFNCLVDPTLRPDATVYLYDTISGIDGAYKLTDVNHTGDYANGSFIVSCNASKVGEIVEIVYGG
jgi:hypothetical protein